LQVSRPPPLTRHLCPARAPPAQGGAHRRRPDRRDAAGRRDRDGIWRRL